VEHFNKSEIPVFLISLKAGGTGLNIIGADSVILLDPWWNPAVESQAIDRVHRLGQKNVVHVYRLLTRGTIEEKIRRLQSFKKEVFDSLVSQNYSFISHMTWDDLREMLELD
jgi:SNF2 family DNA or RNA helicase